MKLNIQELNEYFAHRGVRETLEYFLNLDLKVGFSTSFGVEDQTGRIVFTTNAEVLYVEDRFLFHRDGRAHFQHVRAEHQIVAFLEVVGVILHK